MFATYAVRMVAYGFLSVILGLYLASLGLDLAAIGAIFTTALVGGAVMTVVLPQTADRLGRRRVLMLGGGLMAIAGAVFAVAHHPLVLDGVATPRSASRQQVVPTGRLQQPLRQPLDPLQVGHGGQRPFGSSVGWTEALAGQAHQESLFSQCLAFFAAFFAALFAAALQNGLIGQ